MWADSHAHLYHSQFDADRADMIQRATEVGVTKIVLPNIDAASVDAMLELQAIQAQLCFATLGLHPCDVRIDFLDELNKIKKYFDATTVVAIGEAGLDYHWDKTFVSQQHSALQIQIDWAIEKQLPIILHTRDSMNDTVTMIEKNKSTALKGVFHCFSGSFEIAQRIVNCGFKLGIGGVVTYKNSNLVEVLPRIGLQHLVLETDAPFLPPTPHRGQRNESSYIPYIGAKVAEIMGCSINEVASMTSANTIELFSLAAQQKDPLN